MNDNRRKQLKTLIKQLEELYEKLECIKNDSEEISVALGEIRDEEEESYDNLPESLQESAKGERIQENIESLESAVDEVDNIDIEEALNYIEMAIEYINEAIAKN